jgi:hypothetical protein
MAFYKDKLQESLTVYQHVTGTTTALSWGARLTDVQPRRNHLMVARNLTTIVVPTLLTTSRAPILREGGPL